MMSIGAEKTVEPNVSIIVPCYNALGKIEKCLASLDQIASPSSDYEVIFVDDCSTDGTFALLTEYAAARSNWQVLRLNSNSGSPSRPRNRGVEAAKGEYVFFLDCDDEIFADTIRIHYAHAKQKNADIVRGHLIADDGRERCPMNKIEEWKNELSMQQRIELIIRRQSTTVPSLIKRAFLKEKKIEWPEEIRIGEDTLFLIDVLVHAKCIEYIEHPTFIYNKAISWTPSSTQQYGARELRNHLHVWREAERKLLTQSVSYYETRLQIGLQTVLKALLWRGTGDISDECYMELSEFFRENWRVIRNFTFNTRFSDIASAIRSGNVGDIRAALRPRLVVSGYDLKFAKQVLPALETRFDVKFDEWSGHATHDEKQSLNYLDWAEVIWCEWLLENAVWWSERKRRNQVLLVRMHRFEVERDFGERVRANAVDGFFCVSVLYFEKLVEKFGYDRRSVRLLPNLVDTTKFQAVANANNTKNLAIIGVLPSRKGLKRAIDVLAALRKEDPAFKLHVYGQQANDVPWVRNNQQEREYFQECDQSIADNDVEDAVIFHGQVSVPEAFVEHRIGFVLSVSDHEAPESFHLAPAEGFAGGAQGVFLDWDGVEYLYPDRYIFPSLEKIKNYILSQQDQAVFDEASRAGRDFVEEHYNANRFITIVDSAVREFC